MGLTHGRFKRASGRARRGTSGIVGGALLLAATLGGCLGAIGGLSTDGGVTTKPANKVPFKPQPATIHRLTSHQLQNSWSALFGTELVIPIASSLPSDDQAYGFRSISAAMRTISPLEAEQYEQATYAVIDQVWAKDGWRDATLGCAPMTLDDPCIRVYFAKFGRRAWRRPLVAEEVDELVALSKKVDAFTSSTPEALKFATASLLQSPNFLFRIEQGLPVGPEDPEHEGLFKLTGLEMATRTSYLLLDSPPSEGMLDAAEQGLFDNPELVRAALAYTLDQPEARGPLVRFFRDFMNIGRLDELDKNIELFPAFSQTLGPAMRTEIEKLFEAKVFDERGDFRSLFTTRTTFVNDELAKVYGIDGITGPEFVAVTLPNDGKRSGLLTTPGFLAMNAHKTATSPTHRGRFVRMNLLCQDVPPPPMGVSTALPEPTPSEPKTLRERLEAHREDELCRSCHQLMDPIGFGLEHFDALGQWRDLEAGLAIDAVSDIDGRPFDGAVELSALVAELPEVGVCIARRFYQHATARLDTKGDRPAVDSLVMSFVESDFDFRALVIDMVINDGFRYVSAPKETP